MSDIRNEVARAEGWTFWESRAANGIREVEFVPPGGSPRFADAQQVGPEAIAGSWTIGSHPTPPLDSDACLGYALRRIRELGWEWTNDGIEWWAGKVTDDSEFVFGKPVRYDPTVCALHTGNDASDALHLLLAVLAATKPAARADEGRGG